MRYGNHLVFPSNSEVHGMRHDEESDPETSELVCGSIDKENMNQTHFEVGVQAVRIPPSQGKLPPAPPRACGTRAGWRGSPPRAASRSRQPPKLGARLPPEPAEDGHSCCFWRRPTSTWSTGRAEATLSFLMAPD